MHDSAELMIMAQGRHTWWCVSSTDQGHVYISVHPSRKDAVDGYKFYCAQSGVKGRLFENGVLVSE